MVNGEPVDHPEKDPRIGLKIPLSVLLPDLILILILLGLSIWSREGSTTHVKIEVRDNQYTLFLDGKEISSASLPGSPTGGIGYEQYPNPLPDVPHFQTITNLVVTDLNTGEILFRENFEGSELDAEKWPYTQGTWEVKDNALTAKNGQSSIFHFQGWKNYTLEADVGNMIGAKFFVRVKDRSHYVGCTMRPFRHFDSGFYVVKGGRQSDRTPNRYPLISPLESIKRSVSLILYYLPHSILIFILLVFLSFLFLLFLYWFYPRLRVFVSITLKDPPEKASPPIRGFFTGLTLLFCIAAFFWLYHVTTDYLEGIPHVQDSATMLFQAKILAGGRLWTPEPVDKNSFSLPGFTPVKNGKMFGQYPFGHPLFLVPGVWIHQVRIMPALGGALLLFIVFLIGKELLSAPWGFLASVLLFCSPFYQMTAPNFMSHTTGALYLALSFYFLIRTENAKRWFLQPFLSGVFLGLLMNTRIMTAAAVSVPFGLFMLYTLFQSKQKKRLLLKYLSFGMGLLLLFGFYCLCNYQLMGDPLRSTYGTASDKVLKKAIDYYRMAKAGLDNFTLAGLFMMVILSWKEWVVSFFFLGSLFPGNKKGVKYSMLMIGCIVFVFFGYMFYSISVVTVMYGPRYVFEIAFLFILMIVLGARSVVHAIYSILTWLSSSIRGQLLEPNEKRLLLLVSNAFLTSGVFIVLIGMSAMGFATWRSETGKLWPDNDFIPSNVYKLRGFNYTSPVIQKLVLQNNIKNALIFVERPAPQWWHYGSVFAENTPRFDGDIVYAVDQSVEKKSSSRGEKEKERNKKIISHYSGRKYYVASYSKKQIWEIDRELNRIGDIIRLKKES